MILRFTLHTCTNCHLTMDGDARTVSWHVDSGECADIRTAAEEQADEDDQ